MKIKHYQTEGFVFTHHQGLLTVTREDEMPFVAFNANQSMTHKQFLELLRRERMRKELIVASVGYLTMDSRVSSAPVLGTDQEFHMALLAPKVLQRFMNQADNYQRMQREAAALEVQINQAAFVMQNGLQAFMNVPVSAVPGQPSQLG